MVNKRLSCAAALGANASENVEQLRTYRLADIGRDEPSETCDHMRINSFLNRQILRLSDGDQE